MLPLSANAGTLAAEFDWLAQVIQVRFESYFQQEAAASLPSPPPLPEQAGPFGAAIREYLNGLSPYSDEVGLDELAAELGLRLLVVLALGPHLRPSALDAFFIKNTVYDRGFTEFGGLTGKQHGGFLPTGETALFLLSGTDFGARARYAALLEPTSPVVKQNVVSLADGEPNEPYWSGALLVGPELLSLATTGQAYRPRFGSAFPAELLETRLEWSDLVLVEHLARELEEMATWMEHEQTIMQDWGMAKTLKPGYRALFYGPPGTGKSLCATLLGKRAGLPVYRVDLSRIVSKYIGETEKNLSRLFDEAEHKNWILFFDEADALFGKRTATKGANDRYANQEVAYLLQRIESYNGLVILATNLKGNIDEAFSRRFQSMLFFALPEPEQRELLWRQAFGPGLPLAEDVDPAALAQEFELSGGAMINVVRYCAVAVLRDGRSAVAAADLRAGIRRELRKSGRSG